MTRDEAINTLANFKIYISGGGVTDKKANEALDMAIEALKERPKGKWRYRIVGDNVKRVCSCCGWGQSCNYPWYMGHHYWYCPHCGADMRGREDDESRSC